MNRPHLSRPALITADKLTKHFPLRGRRGRIHAVDDVSFSVAEGQTLGVVGESGCGKSTLARLVLRLTAPTSGCIIFDGVDLATLNARQLRARRKQMQMIFQDAYASLDARQKIGRIIAEPMKVHGIGSRTTRHAKVAELLELVGLEPDAAHRYPHEFSGGQRQRIGIARAIALEPKLVVADEPVSALDVSIQSQVLNLLVKLRRRFNLSFIFISHDLSVVEHFCDTIIVMYLGEVVESADADTFFRHPTHPYTRALISAIPRPDPQRRGASRMVLTGDIPDPAKPPPGCRFHTRCPMVQSICRRVAPMRVEISAGHFASCHFPQCT